MCIIAVKPQGQAPLPITAITACWNNNPDGAGFVIRRPGHDYLLIQKGFMTLDGLLAALDASAIQDRDTVIYHFRIATSGGITPANCHPFPISGNLNDLKSLTVKCKTAFVHNGILGKGSGDLSDTQLYILKTLSRYGNIKSNLPKIRKDTVGSRTAILNADGQLWLTGTWVEEDAYHFSNRTFTDLGWYDFAWDMPDTCDYCQGGLPLIARDDILVCEQCGAQYAACHDCEVWQPINDMKVYNDNNDNTVFVCSFCAKERSDGFGWLDGHGNSRARADIERFLKDWA